MRKWCAQEVPDHTTLRKTYLRRLFEGTIETIRAAIGDDRTRVSVDETTDARGQFVRNVLVGCLKATEPSTPFLIGSEVVAATNRVTLAPATPQAAILISIREKQDALNTISLCFRGEPGSFGL
mgnify:CR=1 FL=1